MGRFRYWTCVLASLAAVFLSGCSATGPTYASMSGVMPALPENGCRVVFYRADSGLGIAVQPEIRLNSMVVGRSVSGGFFYVDTPPGRHLATSQTEVEARLEFDIAAGQTVYVASRVGMGLLVGRVHLSLSEEPQALADLPTLRYTGVPNPAAHQASAPPAAASTPPPRADAPARRSGVTMADLDALLPPRAADAAR